MEAAKRAGRIISLLILIQMIGGSLANFVLEAPLFGHDVVFPMLTPLGLSQLALAVWLMAKGFRAS